MHRRPFENIITLYYMEEFFQNLRDPYTHLLLPIGSVLDIFETSRDKDMLGQTIRRSMHKGRLKSNECHGMRD